MKRRPVAVLDACVLVPMPLADTFLRLAEPPVLFEARWTDAILGEVTRTLEHHFGKSPEKARYRETAMREFFPGSLVCDYERLIPEMENHPKDRHVLAAAVAWGTGARLAVAAAPSSDAGDGGLEEIVVTALRRETNSAHKSSKVPSNLEPT